MKYTWGKLSWAGISGINCSSIWNVVGSIAWHILFVTCFEKFEENLFLNVFWIWSNCYYNLLKDFLTWHYSINSNQTVYILIIKVQHIIVAVRRYYKAAINEAVSNNLMSHNYIIIYQSIVFTIWNPKTKS